MRTEPKAAGSRVELDRAPSRGALPATTVGMRVFFCALILLLGPMAWWQRHGLPTHRSIPPSSFLEYGGTAFQMTIPTSLFIRRQSDTGDGGNLSDLQLFEGSRELGPRHVTARAIESSGRGAFNDWEGSVVLSTSDNSDPRTNGRLYSAVYRAYPSIAAQDAYVVVCAVVALIAAEAVLLAGLRPWRRPTRWTRAQLRHLGTTAVLYGAGAVIVMLSFHGLNVRGVLSPGNVESFGGSAYIAGLPTRFAPLFVGSGDDVKGGSQSNLAIMEDGRPLGPSHAPHAQIRSEGSGAYTHWGDGAVFSASDNSDPRDNNRTYSVAYRAFLDPAVAGWSLALCGAAVVLRFLLQQRPMARDGYSLTVSSRVRAMIAAQIPPSFRPSSLLRFGGLVVAYTAALLLLYGSLMARQNDTGGFKINFEYKVF